MSIVRRKVRHVDSEGRRYEQINTFCPSDSDENDPLMDCNPNTLSSLRKKRCRISTNKQFLRRARYLGRAITKRCLEINCLGICLTDDDDDDCWKEKGRSQELAWKWNITQLLVQWSHCFSHAVIGSRSWIGGLLSRSLGKRQGNAEKFVLNLSPLQEERLRKLQLRVQVPFDGSRLDHQEALKDLWQAAFPTVELRGLVSEQWKQMGWQGPDPSTDFRGGGFISLENLLFYAKMFPKSFHRLLFKVDGKRATWEYPFAVAGINVSFMLIQMLDLCSDKPRSRAGINFMKILAEEEMAFDLLYCVAFEMIDAQWLAMRASYMEFNEVMKAARSQLERELSLDDINHIHDLPAYNLLFQM